MKNLKIISILFVVVALLVSCATGTGVKKSGYDKGTKSLEEENPKATVDTIKSQKDEYKDAVLYFLDLGMAQFYAGSYEDALESFDSAKEFLSVYEVESVSENVNAILTNDYAKSYSGEKYEAIMINVFSSLCYKKLADEGVDYKGYDCKKESLVEVRQADTLMTDFSVNAKEQESFVEKLVLAITPNPFEYFTVPSVNDFTGSAFVDYVSMLAYMDNDDSSNARVDYNRVVSKLGASAAEMEDVEVPEGKARVNLLAFVGHIGEKESIVAKATTKAPEDLEISDVEHNVCWPWFVPNESDIESVELSCSNGLSTKAMEIEDFNELAMETLAMDVKSSYLKSFYRGYTKVLAAQKVATETRKVALEAAEKARTAALQAAQSAYNTASSSSSKLLSIAAKATYNSAVKAADKAYQSACDAANKAYDSALKEVNDLEIADTRMGRYFPASVSVAGMTLDPGVYDFTVTYQLKNGKKIVKNYPGVNVEFGQVNLVVSSCAK